MNTISRHQMQSVTTGLFAWVAIQYFRKVIDINGQQVLKGLSILEEGFDKESTNTSLNSYTGNRLLKEVFEINVEGLNTRDKLSGLLRKMRDQQISNEERLEYAKKGEAFFGELAKKSVIAYYRKEESIPPGVRDLGSKLASTPTI